MNIRTSKCVKLILEEIKNNARRIHMSIELNYNRSSDQKKQKSEKNYGNSEKFIIGCKAAAGVPIEEISKESGMSREYIYQQKDKVEAYAASLDEPMVSGKIIVLTKEFIVRTILVLALYCCSSLRGIQEFFEQSCGIAISIGYISGVINEASQRAQAFDDKLSLEGIRQGAIDEIYQGNTPILTGIDPVSTFIFLMEEAKNRTAETWEIYLRDCKDRGLNLKTSLNDGAAGLIAGVSKVYSEVVINETPFMRHMKWVKRSQRLNGKRMPILRKSTILGIELRASMCSKKQKRNLTMLFLRQKR